ncbi:hypothetical protein, partial [Escherichia coli]|uniref:hypothetical protein n=1 Tax=Escherichia coli TaxID=562 RepID=UPI0032E44680
AVLCQDFPEFVAALEAFAFLQVRQSPLNLDALGKLSRRLKEFERLAEGRMGFFTPFLFPKGNAALHQEEHRRIIFDV